MAGLGWRRLLAAFAFLLAGGAAAAVASGEGASQGGAVLRVRFGGDAAETRIVVDLDRSISARVARDDDAPTRLVVSLPNVSAKGVLQGKGQGLVKAWTVDNGGGGARLALEVAPGAQVKRRFLLPPGDGVTNYRYVIDVATGGPAPVATPVKAPKATPAMSQATAMAAVEDGLQDLLPPSTGGLSLKKVVVIDAGHGGHDPGAQSSHNNEKDITLAAAKALKARLEKTGRYQVVMTRDADVYVPLETRVQIARKAGADLFISLHADSAGDNAGAHGASVYTLSDRGGERVGKVIDRNDWFVRTGNRAGDPAVGQILLDLTQRSTRNRSAVFAGLVVDRISDRVDILPRTHRDAGYFVLLAPDVPAALLEMGFITNPDDESRLVDADQRARLMDGVASAIDAYFSGQTKLASR
ncbi:N-acetylmuramoyl-L-alanine amidase family protein [Caulobacter sp. KR2-114]|uniref:N-acetylmuramoyl-L-alanine amidase family protein n=1 Tax=Caulobacter sp. KR2-114 TaxID=3400912 RepID=UPI003C0E7624